METSPSPSPISVFILLWLAVAPQAESTMLANTQTDNRTNHLDFISLSLGNLMGQRFKETVGLALNSYLLSRVMTPQFAFRYDNRNSIIWNYRLESQLEISDNDSNLFWTKAVY